MSHLLASAGVAYVGAMALAGLCGLGAVVLGVRAVCAYLDAA